jgi:hypothetical protein
VRRYPRLGELSRELDTAAESSSSASPRQVVQNTGADLGRGRIDRDNRDVASVDDDQPTLPPKPPLQGRKKLYRINWLKPETGENP